MRIGVTGGQGFIGTYVCEELERRGHEPVVFDRRLVEGHGWEFMLGDVTDEVATMELGAHTDGIIHLAAMLGTQEWVYDPKPAAKVNIFGTLNVLESCKSNGIPMTYIAVGNHEMCNSYSTSKTAAERFCRQFADQGMPVNIVRAVNAYGPRQSVAKPYGSARVRKVIPSFTCRALSGDPLEVYGDGLQVSDCVHVTDVARVLVTSLEKAADGHVFDVTVEVGPVAHHTVLDIARFVKNAAVSASPIVHLPMRPGEEPGAHVVADVSTLALVGEDPSRFVPLDRGLFETVAWFREHRGVTWA
jgi:nucleoside-diphosphate-sugar epimerase